MSAAGGGVGRNPKVVGRRALHSLIIIMRNANKDADVAALLQIEDDAGVFDRLPRRLQQQTMLRVYVRSFARRDAKKLRIEFVDLIQEASPLDERLSRDPWFGIVVALDVPSICRDLADGVAAPRPGRRGFSYPPRARSGFAPAEYCRFGRWPAADL